MTDKTQPPSNPVNNHQMHQMTFQDAQALVIEVLAKHFKKESKDLAEAKQRAQAFMASYEQTCWQIGFNTGMQAAQQAQQAQQPQRKILTLEDMRAMRRH